MPNCSYCSAPLPPNAIVCEYCKKRNDTDLKGLHEYTTHTIDSARTCPRCNITLRTIDLKLNGTFLIERCDECFGLFFDPGELEALLEATVSNVFDINRSKIDALNTQTGSTEYGVCYIKCPICSKFMNRVNFGIKSGVIVDRCRDHGVWLDGGELRRLFEWMKAGGMLLSMERQEQFKKEEERAEKRSQGHSGSGWHGSNPYFDEYGSDLKLADPDLFEIIKKAVRWFL